MTRHRRRRAVTTTIAAVVLLGLSGAALAWWSGVGSGASTATSGTSAAVTLSPGTPGASLYPGSSAAIQLSIANPGASDVRVGSLALSTAEGAGGFEVDAAHPDCVEGSLGYVTQDNGGAGWTVPSGGSLAVILPGALTMSLDADDGCQGATFVVYLAAVG